MSEPKHGPSTQSLITEAERLRGERKSSKPNPEGTRQLVRDAERLIGRPSGLGGKLMLVVGFLIGLALAGVYLVFK